MNISIPKGSLFGLIGPNGSGKSTTMNMITTLLKPSSGTLKVLGLDVTSEADAVRGLIGLAPEEPALFSGLTALEYVRLSGVIHDMPEEEADKAARQWLARFELTDKQDELLGSFSKGMKRKALICACLVHQPQLMVMDEPLDGLDIFAQQTLKQVLKEAADEGRTIIYSTHILETVEGFCSHVGLLQNGVVLDCGPIDAVKENLGIAQLADAFRRPQR